MLLNLLLISLLLYPYKQALYLTESISLYEILVPLILFLFLINFSLGRLHPPKLLLCGITILLAAKFLAILISIANGFNFTLHYFARDIGFYVLICAVASLLRTEAAHERFLKVLIFSFFISNVLIVAAYLLFVFGGNRDFLSVLLTVFRQKEIAASISKFGFPIFFTQTTDYLYRASIGNAVDYAFENVYFVPVLIYSLLNSGRRRTKIFLFFATVLCFIAILISFSRSALIALVIVLLTIFLQQKRQVNVRKCIFVVVCTCAILFVGIIAGNEDLSRFAGKRFGLNTSGGYSSFGEQVMSDRSVNNRLSFFKVAVQISLDNPLGIGLGNFMEENKKITGAWNSAESMYAQMLAEEGLMIVLLFTIVVIVLGGFFVVRNRYHNRFYCKIYSAFLITYLITAFFYTAQSEMLGYVMLGATFSTAFLSRKKSLEKQNAAL